MKRLQSGAAHTADDESEDLEIDYSDDEEQGEEEPGSDGDFFDGEDLDEVEIQNQGGDEDDEIVSDGLEYDSEVEMGEDGEEELSEESEGELLPTIEGQKNKKGDKKKKN